MKKANKLLALGLLSLTLSLASCGEETPSSSLDDEIHQIYAAYQENGGTLSYEEWLSSIKGEKGDPGEKGEKGEDGKPGKDGTSVTSIALTSSSDNVDTYTITYSDGTTSTFKVTNGKDGAQGIQGEPGANGHTPAITIGENGNWFIDGADSGFSAKGDKGEPGEDGSSFLSGVGAPSPDQSKDGDTYLDTSSYDFYVKRDGTWTMQENAKGKHNVTFYVDEEKVNTLQVKHGEKASAPNIDLPGRTLNGWNCKEDGGYRWLFSAYTVTSDLDLYADYSGLDYEVTLIDTNLGEKKVSVTYGEEYDFSDVFTKLGYVVSFANTECTIPTKGTWTLASNATYYASWEADPNYQVTVNSEDKAKGDAEIVSYSSEIGGEVKVKATANEGYIFYAWFEDGEYLSGESELTYIRPDHGVSLEARFLSQKEYDAKYGSNPVLGEDGTTLTYGLYPTTRVKGDATLTALASLTKKDSDPYYFYKGDYYASVEAKTNENTEAYLFDDGDFIAPGTVYWFKCEPIVWNVVSSADGVYSLIAKNAIDGRAYDENSNNYKDSDIRSFLRGDFCGSAFFQGFSSILEQEVDNSESSGINEGKTNSYYCENTTDRLYLPSFAEIDALSSNRTAATTDWARCRGCRCAREEVSYNGKKYGVFDSTSTYWTRSPDACGENYGWVIGEDGYGAHYGTVTMVLGVRPGMKITLSD